jgi:hypothetical protein
MLTNLTKHQNRCLFISVACYGKRKKKEEEKKENWNKYGWKIYKIIALNFMCILQKETGQMVKNYSSYASTEGYNSYSSSISQPI